MRELKFHELSDLFPLMEGEEFDALVADIKVSGLREKIDLYQGKIVDGRNRYRALRQLGIEPDDKHFRKAIYAHTIGGEIAPHEQDNDDRVLAYIISKNIHRRHLTAEQKRDLIAKLVKAQPEKSDRQIAKQVKVDHKTVASVRAKQEATGEVSPVEKRVGADGKARKQPRKPAESDDCKTCRGRRKIHLASSGKVPCPECRADAFRKFVSDVMPKKDIEEFRERLVAKAGPDIAVASDDGKEWIDANGNRYPKSCGCPAGTLATRRPATGNDIDAPTSAEARKAEYAAEEDDQTTPQQQVQRINKLVRAGDAELVDSILQASKCALQLASIGLQAVTKMEAVGTPINQEIVEAVESASIVWARLANRLRAKLKLKDKRSS
jgi:hypothetical protein